MTSPRSSAATFQNPRSWQSKPNARKRINRLFRTLPFSSSSFDLASPVRLGTGFGTGPASKITRVYRAWYAGTGFYPLDGSLPLNPGRGLASVPFFATFVLLVLRLFLPIPCFPVFSFFQLIPGSFSLGQRTNGGDFSIRQPGGPIPNSLNGCHKFHNVSPWNGCSGFQAAGYKW